MPDKIHFNLCAASRHEFNSRILLAAAVCAALLCANSAALSAAATNRPAARGSTDRYLLIVDTSAAMERNAENTHRIVGQLMASGMVGQAHAGDTIGFWTYSEALQTGGFPLQRWTPQTRDRLASAAVEFLGKHRYEKRSRFEKVAEPLTSVIKDSEKITVLIITDGSGKISGTPFDQEINESYRLNQAAQRKQRMPFITILRAKDGEYIGWRVNAPPFRPEFPAFPVEPKVAEPPARAVESKPSPAANTATSNAPVSSLIVVGEPPTTVSRAPTNAPITQPPVIQTPVAPDPLSQSKPDAQPVVPVETPRATVGTETPVGVNAVEAQKTDPQPPSPVPAVASIPSETAPKPSVTRAPAPKADSSALSKSEQDSSTPPSSRVQTNSAADSEAPASMAQTAVATPAESLFNRTSLLITGAVLLVVAFGVFYVLMRRTARSADKVSLITRSMDHDVK